MNYIQDSRRLSKCPKSCTEEKTGKLESRRLEFECQLYKRHQDNLI